MPQIIFRVVGVHVDAGKSKIKNYEPEQFLVNCNTIARTDGSLQPDPADVKTRLSNNSKLRGSDFIMSGYANVDKEHQGATTVLS